MTGEEIKKLRLSLGLSQQDFSQLIGVAFGTVNRWERGRSKASKLAIEKMQEIKEEGRNGRLFVCQSGRY